MKNNVEFYYNKCFEFIVKIKNPVLRKCGEEIFRDFKEKLVNKPATINSHHFYKGGLLIHTYCVTRNAITICNLYPELEVDLDLIIFGGLFHDIGKTKEYYDFSEDNNEIHPNNSSVLLGHSYEGAHIVETYLTHYEIEEDFKNQVIHIIGSHMNEYSEWGAIVMPKMLEAIIVNYADSMDSYLEPAHEIIKEVSSGEKYKIVNAPRDYYKSLNPFYFKEN